jgi:hypothetical protein
MEHLFFIVDVSEETVQGIKRFFIKLDGDEINRSNFRVLATDATSGKKLVHAYVPNRKSWNDVLQDWDDHPKIQRLKQHVNFVGRSYKHIAQQAKAGSTLHKRILKAIIYTTWDVGGELYRGTLGEWITAGKPPRLSGWSPAMRVLGREYEVDIPNDDDVNE